MSILRIIYNILMIPFNIIYFLKFCISSANNIERRAVIMATPTHGNCGDHAIVLAEKRILESYGYNVEEIPNSCYFLFAKLIQKQIKNDDVIVVDGGGNLGTLWEREDNKISDIICRFKKNKIIVFPQTIYYDSDSQDKLNRNIRIYGEAIDLTIMLRDCASYNFALENFKSVRCRLIPDVVLSMDNIDSCKSRDGVLLCFRGDKEKITDSQLMPKVRQHLQANNIPYRITDTVLKIPFVLPFMRTKTVLKKLNEFSSAKLVITDRLHGMIFATICGTPCISLDNSSKKVSRCYNEFLKKLDYIYNTNSLEDVFSKFSKIYNMNGKFSFIYPNLSDILVSQTRQ